MTVSRWIRSFASSPLASDFTASMSRPPCTRYCVEVYTPAPWSRSRPSRSSRASFAVLPSLSVTPGLKPTSTSQSQLKSSERESGLSIETTFTTGSEKSPLAAVTSSSGASSQSIRYAFMVLTDPTLSLRSSLAFLATLAPRASFKWTRSATSILLGMNPSK